MIRYFIVVLVLGGILSTTSQANVKLGFPVPNFTLMDTHGEPVKLSDYAGKYVVLEWLNPDCPAVKRHYEHQTMIRLAKEYLSHEVIWLAINSTAYMGREDNLRWKQWYNVFYRILDDHNGKVGQAYQAQTTPHIFIINPQRLLVYRGAIDNAPKGRATVNYVKLVLDELLTGEPVTTAKTKPYGCAVKYEIPFTLSDTSRNKACLWLYYDKILRSTAK